RESVYTRFFTYKRELGADELAHIETMDFVHDVMLVVTTQVNDEEIVIASARYVADDATADPCAAEVAFTVEENYQGRGIAGRLLRHLAGIARECGMLRFVADVLPQNKAMLAVFARSGLPMRQQRQSGTVHLTLELMPVS